MQYYRLFLFACLIFIHTGALLNAQCNQDVKPSENKVLRYQDRGNRCEGFYDKKVGSEEKIWLVSFTLGRFNFKADNQEVIRINVPAGGANSVTLAARGIPRDLYYRMDAEISGGKTFEWDVASVLYKNERTKLPENIGLLAFIKKGQDELFLPVKTEAKLAGKPASSKPMLTLVASKPLTNVNWRLNGGAPTFLKGFFSTGSPIKIELPENLKGEYRLEIEGKIKNQTDKIPYSVRIKI